MKAITYHDYGGKENLRFEDMPAPTPGAGQVLIAVKAAAVNPVDWKLREGWRKEAMPFDFPVIPGADIAGVVEAVGVGVTAFKPGDAVFAMTPNMMGAYAEYVAIDAAVVARKPASLDYIQAASVPLAALTAWQGLIEGAALGVGQRVLIDAAAGGVGSFAVQLARWKNAEVIATASAGNHDYLHGLGAQCIDYRTQKFADAIPASSLDAVLGLMGGESYAQALPLLKPGGALIMVGGPPRQPLADAARRLIGLRVAANSEQLARIAALFDEGKMVTEVAQVIELCDAASAHGLVQEGHTRGKIVLRVRD